MARILAIVLALAALNPALATSSAALAAAKRVLAAKELEAVGLPDPKCATGVISMKAATGKDPQVCCAGYCGECSNYPTCASVRGQNSTFACCQEKVYTQRCGGGAAANVCLKKCSESVPPCIMDDEEANYKMPSPVRHAGTDCNDAKQQWNAKVASVEEYEVPKEVGAGK
mmetsp:Transcript_10552/g.28169  ORF Transcript_10552/g.28169 Transcript_10552/m.28169 type:complete len:171 (-) Transcript_10552:120-632(-)